jgi:hypothetical protein
MCRFPWAESVSLRLISLCPFLDHETKRVTLGVPLDRLSSNKILMIRYCLYPLCADWRLSPSVGFVSKISNSKSRGILKLGQQVKLFPFEIICYPDKFGIFWSSVSIDFMFCKFESIPYLENPWNKRKKLSDPASMQHGPLLQCHTPALIGPRPTQLHARPRLRSDQLRPDRTRVFRLRCLF